VSYRRRTADEIDRKIVPTVTELGQITNGVVQALLDVKLDRASKILADLVEREILIKTSAHERGPRVTYGPGRLFPAKAAPRARTRKPKDEGHLPFEDPTE
jgi:ATP-dependent DNA helicase RecG